MHIGFVAHNFVRGNGQGRINFEVVRHAARQGHRVTLMADQAVPELTSEPGVTWEPIRQWPRKPNLLGVRQFAAAADRKLRQSRGRFDVVVGAGYTQTEAHDVNLCQFVHGAWIKSPVHVAKLSRGPWAWYQWAYTRANVRWEQAGYAKAKMVVAPSVKIRDELLSIGLPADRVSVIYNGVDPVEFHPRDTPEADSAERTILGLPGHGPLALFCGDIRTPRKNLDSVLKALVHVPGLHLGVVGALDNSPFPAMAKELGIADRVTFVGYRRDVDRFMRAADLFIFPSRYEAGTLVLMEAAASGLPIVTARTAGGCEVLGPDAAETLADPDDVPGLVRAIGRFADSPEARRLASAASRAVAERHTWTDMAEKYLQLMLSYAPAGAAKPAARAATAAVNAESLA